MRKAWQVHEGMRLAAEMNEFAFASCRKSHAHRACQERGRSWLPLRQQRHSEHLYARSQEERNITSANLERLGGIRGDLGEKRGFLA